MEGSPPIASSQIHNPRVRPSQAAPDPAPEPPYVEGQLEDHCLTAHDQHLINTWQNKLNEQVMVFCPRCKIRWFDLELRNGICRSCYRRDTVNAPKRGARRAGEPGFWSAANKLDPGDFPEHLPELTQVEEMLISRVHAFVQVMTYRGQQYRYKGHVIHFLKDVGQIYDQLPLLPRDLDIFILRPANQTKQPHMIRQFRGQSRVRQQVIRTWLEHLKQNHPGYADVEVNEQALSQLPVDGDVADQLATETGDEVLIKELFEDPYDSDERHVQALRNQLGNQRSDDTTQQVPLQPVQQHLEMPTTRSAPLNEFNRSQAFLSLAFPSLYPNGAAEYVTPRIRSVSYKDYIERLIKYHDRRFAQHPRFQYVAFNTLMRQQFKVFLKEVIIPKFGVVEYWYRYEWQARGSTHCPGLFWLEDAPRNPNLMQYEAQQLFSSFWGNHVTSWNPNLSAAGDQRDIDPLITITSNPTFQDLSDVVNKDMNTRYWVYDGARNDAWLNNYNRTFLMSWLANIDTSPCTSVHAVLNYIAKYCSKAEKKTESFNDIAKSILPRVNASRSVVSFVAKFMNRLLTERDWSAQEVHHLLLNLNLQEGTRIVRSVDCRRPDEHWQADFIPIDDQGASVRASKNTYQKYLTRPDSLQDFSYFRFLTRVDFTGNTNTWREFPSAADRILNYFPRYKSLLAGGGHEDYENYCRVKLMLHHPHRSFDQLLEVEGEHFDTYLLAYQHCMDLHGGAHPRDYYDTIPELPDEEDEVPPEAWQDLASQLPQHDPDSEEVDLLGNRDIDQGEYWHNVKATFAQESDNTVNQEAVNSLNPEQRLVYNLFVDHLTATQDPNAITPQPLLCQVDGQGGTEKSFLIQTLSMALNSRAPGCVVRAAPTGIAANAIDGATLHSLLRLPVSKQVSSLTALSGNELSNIKASMADVKYLILDKKSMVGLKTFYSIDARLPEVFPEHQHDYFGGRSIFLLGDFYQLPPVFEKPLYALGDLNNALDLAGRNSYREFNHTVELQQVVRHQGDDQAPFRQALQNLRVGKRTRADWQLLCTRTQSQLGREEVASFNEAVRIYPTNQQVRDHNRDHMEQLNKPVFLINASHGSQYGNNVDSQNRWWSPQDIAYLHWFGLVNGAMGIVEDLAWEDRPEGVDTRTRPPDLIMVHFDKYTGPEYFDDEPEMAGIVPIFRSNREYMAANRLCSRRQFPLTVSYAITAHKSQGTTLDKAVADISQKDFTSGLTYVTISRVKTLQGIMFESSFDLNDITSATNVEQGARELDMQRRQAQMLLAR
uniref:ATP-dependent DNA helicase n=1 Tax=Gibberella zeae TaxID=5518 RepID=A0A4E9ER58_GIBZA